jgi:hypothetical protein
VVFTARLVYGWRPDRPDWLVLTLACGRKQAAAVLAQGGDLAAAVGRLAAAIGE